MLTKLRPDRSSAGKRGMIKRRSVQERYVGISAHRTKTEVDGVELNAPVREASQHRIWY